MKSWVRHRSGNFWIGAAVIVVVVAIMALGSLLSWGFWEELHNYEGGSAASTIRSIALVIAAPIALVLAVWRSIVASRQADTAQLQAGIAERGLLNERYQKGAEMLGSPVLAVRLGGIYAAQRLAEEHPLEYHLQVMRLFCSFVRNPPYGSGPGTAPGEDVIAILDAIAYRGTQRIRLELKEDFRLDLTGVSMRSLEFREADFSQAILIYADLSEASFRNSNFDDVDLGQAILFQTRFSDSRLRSASFVYAQLLEATFVRSDLSKASLSHANLSDANIMLTTMRGTDLSRCTVSGARFEDLMFLQTELDRAWPDTNNNLPQFSDCTDPDTGEPLVWNERPFGWRLDDP